MVRWMYHFSVWEHYGRISISNDERWFYSEQEARAAGGRRLSSDRNTATERLSISCASLEMLGPSLPQV